jgi:hypothetical protein
MNKYLSSIRLEFIVGILCLVIYITILILPLRAKQFGDGDFHIEKNSPTVTRSLIWFVLLMLLSMLIMISWQYRKWQGCKDGGSIFVTVPAHMELWSEHDEVNHHYRRYKIEQLMELFIQTIGNKVHFASYFNYRLYPFVWLLRRVSGWWRTKRKDDGNLKSDFDSFKVGFLNNLFYWIMKGESSYLMKKIKQRNGVSIMLHWLNKS